jgi:D-inositol-3-phosphate glycosyltransferase
LGGNGSGGMSVYLKELTSGLAGYPGVYVDIVTRADSPICAEAKDISPQIRVVELKGGPESPMDRKDLYEFIPEFSQNLADFVQRRKHNYDVIHTHYWLSGLAGSYVKQRHAIPLVHTYHTLGFLKRRVRGLQEHKCRRSSEQHLAHASDVIISPSGEEKKTLIKEYGISPTKVRVVYPGVNSRLFYPVDNHGLSPRVKNRPGGQSLLYVGRIEPVKGLMTMIQALGILKEKNPVLYDKMKLYIVGGGKEGQELTSNPEVARIREEMRKRGLLDKVVFLGSVKQNQLNRYYSAADALVFPSLYESFGLVAVEALACGTPVIVSHIGKMPTIVREGKNGYLFSPNNPDSLAVCMEIFFSRKEKLWRREKIREDIIRRYSWEKTAEETNHILSRVANQGIHPTTIFPPDETLQPV